ncbi:PTS sugar transporter subunit IIA [Verrucomicrobiota bacterium]
MNLKKILSKESIIMDLKGQSKDAILAELTDFLASNGKINDREGVITALKEREAKMSTGMSNGIAIPHAKTDLVKEMVALIALKKDGVDFAAMDGQPCNIFIMTLSPATGAGPHIQFLAEVSRLLSQEPIREKILASTTKQEVLEHFLNN